MAFERGDKQQGEIKLFRRKEHSVLGIEQEGLAVAVGVGPKGEMYLFQRLDCPLLYGDLDQSGVPLEEYPVGKDEVAEDEQEDTYE